MPFECSDAIYILLFYNEIQFSLVRLLSYFETCDNSIPNMCVYIYIYRFGGCLGYASVVMERLCDAQTFVVLLLLYRTYEMRE